MGGLAVPWQHYLSRFNGYNLSLVSMKHPVAVKNRLRILRVQM